MLDLWNSFWFKPEPALNLGIARVLILGYFFLFKVWDRAYDFRAWEVARRSLKPYWQRPWLLEIIPVPLGGPRADAVLSAVFKLSLLLGVAGVFTQISCAVAFLSGLYLLGLRHGLRTHHTIIPFNFCLLAFALAPSGHAVSVDQYLLPYLGFELQPAPELYGWAIRIMQVVLCLVVFATGVAKMRHVGTGACFHDRGNLADLLRIHDFPYFKVKPIISISALLQKYPALERMAALGTIVVELSFPLVLFWPPARFVLLPSFVGMVVGFRFFIGARFDLYFAMLVALFIPWDMLLP